MTNSPDNKNKPPTIEPLESGFMITDLGVKELTLAEPLGPLFIEKIGSGKVRISDERSTVLADGRLGRALSLYRDRFLEEYRVNPHLAPEIRRTIL